MSRFYEIEPTSENFWRAIILFGRNSASYKFALAKTLLDFHSSGKTLISLEELALPYATHICEHLKKHPKQGTSGNSKFQNYLPSFNNGEINKDELIFYTMQYGFVNVINAFHNVHGKEIEKRFFVDERNPRNSIQLTDDFMVLGEQQLTTTLTQETEARWCLVEAAWENNVSRNLMLVEYEEENNLLFGTNRLRRVAVTSARPALNGYQKGRCFYCFRKISVHQLNEDLADVDHFFPHILKQCDSQKPIDGVANLVLACQECNRGEGGKFERLPSVDLLERLFCRNEYLITSHHPLRETLIAQTGNTTEKRQTYLQDVYNCSTLHLGANRIKWQPKQQGTAAF